MTTARTGVDSTHRPDTCRRTRPVPWSPPDPDPLTGRSRLAREASDSREKRPDSREKRPDSREKRPDSREKRPDSREKRPT
ncbi:MAG: hypothetical protein ACRDRK_27855, partial [Pseudonocardia sp.]